MHFIFTPNSGRINQNKFFLKQVVACMNGVARGAGHVAYNGALLAYQSIQQRRFANIWLADNSKLR